MISFLLSQLLIFNSLVFENLPTNREGVGRILIKKTSDFEVSGNGLSENWDKTSWLAISKLSGQGVDYSTRSKILYSETGIYFLFFCQDKKLSATFQADFMDLWNEDVVELFLQPDSSKSSYLEYEISPLNYELPLIIFNERGRLNSWIPFHYKGERQTKHRTTVKGGSQKSKAEIESWTTEIYIPYELLKPLMKEVPSSGTRWRGNLNRIDYDKGENLWAWQRNSGNFHEFEKFGIFEFE